MSNNENKGISQGSSLNRGLKQRHMTMIAIGGAIGTGLFLTSGYTVNESGPGGAMIAYGLMGIIIYFLMTSLGEMSTFMPVSGSFQVYCSRLIDPAAGFTVGWMYWLNWAFSLSANLVAAEIIMVRYFPSVPGWVWIALFVVVLFLLNIIDVKGYGETEFWFASIKVFAIILFLIVGILMIAGVIGGSTQGVSFFLDKNGGPFPLGGLAVIMVLFSSAYSFTGIECVGMASGEVENPEETVPKAIKTVFWRILLFYIGGMFVIGCLIPYQQAGLDISPFTWVFENSNIPVFSKVAGTFMDIVILTSILSSSNSGIYVGSRMLWSMALEKKAPAALGKLSKKKIPLLAVIVTTAFGLVGLLTSLLPSDSVFVILCAAVGISCIFGWLGIGISHYRFRKWYKMKGYKLEDLKYKAKFYPFGPVATMIAMIFIIVGSLFDAESALSVIIGIPLAIAMFVFYKIKYKTKAVKLSELEMSDLEDLRYQEESDVTAEKLNK